MRTILIIIYLIVPLIGTVIALLSAFPVPPRSAPPARLAEQQHQMDIRTARQREMQAQRTDERLAKQAEQQAAQARNLARNRALCAHYPRDFYLNADGQCELWPTGPSTISVPRGGSVTITVQ